MNKIVKAMKKITFGRILGAIVVLCICWVSGLLTVSFYERHESDEFLADIYSSECHSFICNGKYRVMNMVSGKTTIDDIDWLFASEAYTDSLVVFSRKGKRGYFDRYTGEAAIPEQYTHAWIFSEGLAAVVSDDKVGFIDHRGKTVIDFQYPYMKDNKKQIAFVFHDGYSSMYDISGKCGIINKQGEWLVKPSYEYIQNPEYGKRIFCDEGKYGVLDDSLHVLLPAEYQSVCLTDDYLIAYRPDGSQLQISYEGKILNENIYHDVTSLDYSINKCKDSEEATMVPSGLYRYCSYNNYGLMGEDGKPLTALLYKDITAISKDLFLCSLKNTYSNVVIDRKGNVVGQ